MGDLAKTTAAAHDLPMRKGPQKPFRRIAIMALLSAFLIAFQGAGTVSAQTSDNAPPYESDLMRLSEILGALHFLRPLCGHDDEPSWRNQMKALLESETSDENRRRRFIERFNQGHRGFSSVYRSCTASARLAMEQYIVEGRALISDVTGRYGR